MLQTDNEALAQTLDNLQKINELEKQIKDLEKQHALALKQVKDSYSNDFTRFKADVLICLKALELVAIASQRHGDIALNHRERDQRMEHLQTIIKNSLIDFGDRRISYGYDDDF